MVPYSPQSDDVPGGDPLHPHLRYREERGRRASNRTTPEFGAAGERPIPPFFSQHGRQLLLLDEAMDGWVMAEFWFDPDRCRYLEIRRAQYDWPREAAGALLSRTLPAGVEVLARTAADLQLWMIEHATPGMLDGDALQ